MFTYSNIIWIVISAVLGASVLCAMLLKRKLGIVGWFASFCAFAPVAYASAFAAGITYEFCFAYRSCLKLTGDEEYSFLIPVFFFPLYWVVFIVVNHFKTASKNKD
jgi:predicted benzoate:H+ symporter BenE